MIKKLRKIIEAGEQEIYINLINTKTYGKEMIKMLEDAGYKADTQGPQRIYTK